MNFLLRQAGAIAQAIHQLPRFPGQWRLARLVTTLAGGDLMLLRDKFGFMYFVRRGNIVSHLLLIHQCAEPEILDLLPEFSDTIIDVGCNVGTFALPASRRARRVIAIDANADMCRAVEQNCALNGINNVTVVHAAISQSDAETISFHRARAESSISSLRKEHVEQYDAYDTIEVPNRRLDDLIRELGIERVEALKIDAEGVSGGIIASLGEDAAKVAAIIAEPSDDLESEAARRVLVAYELTRPLAEHMALAVHTRETIVARRQT